MEEGSAEGNTSPDGVRHPDTGGPSVPGNAQAKKGGCKRRVGLRAVTVWLNGTDHDLILSLGNGDRSAGIRAALETARRTKTNSFDADRWARALASDYAPRRRNATTFSEDLRWITSKTRLDGKDAEQVVLHLRSLPP